MRRGRRPEIHHSDQGVQYAAKADTDLLAGRGVAIRMAAAGKPEENGFAERRIRTIREEEIDRQLATFRRQLLQSLLFEVHPLNGQMQRMFKVSLGLFV
jgi:transposase InsO family protein